MSTSAVGVVGSTTIWGKVDYGPTFGQVYRPLNNKRVITAAGAATVIPYDVIIIIAQTVAGAVTLQLPDLNLWLQQPYGGFDLILKNLNLGYDLTILPFAAQTIDGLASLVLGSGQGGGGLIVSPLPSQLGWVTL